MRTIEISWLPFKPIDKDGWSISSTVLWRFGREIKEENLSRFRTREFKLGRLHFYIYYHPVYREPSLAEVTSGQDNTAIGNQAISPFWEKD